MAPNLIGNTFLLAESTIEQEPPKRAPIVTPVQTPVINPPSEQPATKLTKRHLEIDETAKSRDTYKIEIVWKNVLAFGVLHVAALYAVYLMISRWIIFEYVWGHMVGMIGGFGVTAGAHRLWAHKAYKAKLPLRVILMLCQTLSFQNSIHEWVRDHRVHHKFCDTNADPHNSKRGFFFSHMGWLLCKKHPDVKDKGKMVDMTDLETDPVVMFQKRYYLIMVPVFSFVLPSVIPWYIFGRPYVQWFFISSVLRYVASLHFTWLVNSAAHIWGMRPFDQSISPTENKLVSILANGEGWHNYHHVFPWDYKAAELGSYKYNLSTGVIDFFSLIGWAYDLRTVTKDMIQKRVARTGDGTYKEVDGKKDADLVKELNVKHNHEEMEMKLWGWDDRDMITEDKNEARILRKKRRIHSK